MSPRRPSTRAAALAATCVLAVAALAGCIKVDAEVAVNPDATGTGTFALELQKEAASFLGITDLATFESQITEGDMAGDGGLGAFGSCETSESDTGFVYTCSFTDTAFTDLEQGPWMITKEGDLLTFRMVSNATGTEDPAADAATENLLGDASMGSITVDVTFPGPITSATGTGVTQTSETTATISGSLNSPTDVTITAQSGASGFGWATLLVVLIAFAVVALIVVVAVVLIMRRRSGGAPEATAVDDAVAAPAETVEAEVVEVTEVTETTEASEPGTTGEEPRA